MLDIMKTQSVNEFNIIGTLNEIEITEGTSQKTGDGYISCNISVRVDQDINGVTEENIIPIKLFSNRHKKGSKELNNNYDRIKKYGETLTSLGAVEEGKENLASKVSIQAQIAENIFAGRDGRVVNTWQLSSNFINNWRAQDTEGATFEVTGVVAKKIPETDKEGNETGRLIVKMCLVGWGGTANVLDFYASGNSATYIDRNWNEGDTVRAAGAVSITKKVVEREANDEYGFGEPVKKYNTISKRELIILAGSRSGLDEDESYDADDIKIALDKRKAKIAEVENGVKKTANKPANDGFGF